MYKILIRVWQCTELKECKLSCGSAHWAGKGYCRKRSRVGKEHQKQEQRTGSHQGSKHLKSEAALQQSHQRSNNLSVCFQMGTLGS